VARKILLLLAISIPLMLAACGDDNSDSSSTSAETESTESTDTGSTDTSSTSSGSADVSIGETEFALDPADPSVKAGSVTIEAVNNGSITHDLEIDGNGVEEEIEDLDPGASGEVTVDLEPGTYEIYCTIGDHRDQGMDGELTVD
jgi:uncharacterized cupredoxin-like copper-binding protein